MPRKRELTLQEMTAARHLRAGKTMEAVAVELGVSVRTIQRWAQSSLFVEYRDQVRAEQDKKLEALTDAALEKVNFSKGDAVEVLAEIALNAAKDVTTVNRIRAIELLGKLLDWMPRPGVPVAGDGAELPKGNSFKPEWMQ